jgi:hypothetical protein
MTPILFIASGFILGILWVDLKFDWLAVPYRRKPGILPEEVLAPMTYFYRYITGKPIVLATLMLSIVVTIILELVQISVPAWVAWVSLILFGTAMIRSAILVIPTARRFGMRTDDLEKQTSIAHALLGMHLFAFILVLLMTILQFYATVGTKISMLFFVCVGYILSVSWINVKFDWIAVPYRGKPGVLPEEVLAPIALFHRYLKSAVEMGAAMIFILVTLIFEVTQGLFPSWLAWTSLILFVIGMSIPIMIIRSGRRLGARTDSLEKQTSLAHGLLPGHIVALVMILLVGALQVYGLWIS